MRRTESASGDPRGSREAREPDIGALCVEIERWLSAHAPKSFASLRPPVADTTVADVEKVIGHTLPADYLRWCRLHDGRLNVASYDLSRLEHALSLWQDRDELPQTGPIPKADAHMKRIKRAYWHRGWFPIGMESCGNLVCLDLDPEPAGTYGQVIYWEIAEGPFVRERSFGAWLDAYAQALGRGEYVGNELGYSSWQRS